MLLGETPLAKVVGAVDAADCDFTVAGWSLHQVTVAKLVGAPVCLCTLTLVGCSDRPGRAEPPQIDPSAAAAEALASLDSDGDGRLNANELGACPGLNAAIKAVDSDHDGNLSAEEIAARIRQWTEGRVALVAVNCSVAQNGRPLAGATVTFVPEKFLGPNIKPASGI